MDVNPILQEVVNSQSPDLHLQVGQYPIVRLKSGQLGALTQHPVLTAEDLSAVIDQILTPDQRAQYEKQLEFDFSYHVENFGRFRVNVYTERNGPSIAFRVISEQVPTLEQIGLGGEEIERLVSAPNGLILVTGPTGSGKSTTMAAMVEYINENRQAHIITIEDPIEYVFGSENCLVTQREVNVHTRSFSNAIRSALRQDPDVVMVGEMRDLETIAAALTLAETGHLVISTLHTSDAAKTVERVIDVFPAFQQQQVKAQLSTSIKGVISQVLIPRADGEGRVAAHEVMLSNDAIRNSIAQGQISQIYSTIQISAAEGMVLMDQSLENLYNDGIISREDALSKAADFESLSQKLK